MSENAERLQKKRGRKPDLQRRREAAMLYGAGLSCRDVGAQLGITGQAVWLMLKRHGVILRGRGGNRGSHSRHRK